MSFLEIAKTSARALSRDAQTRYEARHSLLDAAGRRLGHPVYNRNLVWTSDADFLDAWSAFPGATADIKDRRYLLWSMALATADLAGDTAECGTYEGASSHLICTTRAALPRFDGQHHVFDSFEGLSEPELADRPASDRTFRWEKHDLAVGETVVARNLAAFPFVRLHAGWIPERFDEVADRTFSFVHVDVDLHQPTYDSISFFYERLVPGGIILCDDYGSAGCPGAKAAFDEVMSTKEERWVIHLPTGQGFIVKR
jgi:O-methyltransferase